MESKKIRSTYIDFFRKKGHTVVPGSSLVPFDDATLLFTSAGMVQFKKLWATDGLLNYSRAVSCQKCMRAGGKDSDFDKIGISSRHHTFFEMLGNFSFGDYFKEEAIEWASEFVFHVLGLPVEKIWVSYYGEDRETFDIWKKFLPAERIVPLGKKDNFWGPAGDTGPCGPCTELYFDSGKEKSCGPGCLPGCDCDRFLEFWNLVFPQYDMQEDKSLLPLRRRGVDTGMGLERISRIMQGTDSNYETDLFFPIIRKAEEVSGLSYFRDTDSRVFFRRISDHVRAAAFLIDDNILPSNEGRGYVLRRIVRRAAVSGSRLGIREPFLYRLSEVPVDIMSDNYPTLSANRDLISGVLHEEEEKFGLILDSASRNFEEFLPEVRENVLPGSVAFRLYDTYGVPRDLIEELAFQQEIKVDWESFDKALQAQKKMSRFSSEGTLHKKAVFESLPMVSTEFTGYGTIEGVSEVKAVYTEEKKKVFHVVLQQTPFYPEKGGQVGDRGVIENGPARFIVTDARLDENGIIYHAGTFDKGRAEDFMESGSQVTARVDAEFRKKVSANHTSTHLLHDALKKVMGKGVRQAGSYVSDDRLRFDFVSFENMSLDQLHETERIVQEAILSKRPVTVREMELEEALKTDAVALFTEKYEDRVRIISIEGYSSEVCGGTHVANTSDIFLFRITGFSSIGKNLKRIEAVTYREAIGSFDSCRETLHGLGSMLETPPEKLLQRLEKLMGEEKEKDRLIVKYQDMIASMISDRLIAGKELVSVDRSCYNYVSAKLGPDDGGIISKIADRVSDSLENAISFIGNEQNGKINFVLKVGREASSKYSAVELVREISSIIGGGGGGNGTFARGSGKNSSRFAEASEKIKAVIKSKGKGE